MFLKIFFREKKNQQTNIRQVYLNKIKISFFTDETKSQFIDGLTVFNYRLNKSVFSNMWHSGDLFFPAAGDCRSAITNLASTSNDIKSLYLTMSRLYSYFSNSV